MLNLQNILPGPISKRKARELLAKFCKANPALQNFITADLTKVEEHIPRGLLFDPNVDYHKMRAAAHFGIKYEDVTREQRAFAKQKFFWQMYGLTPPEPTVPSTDVACLGIRLFQELMRADERQLAAAMKIIEVRLATRCKNEKGDAQPSA